ncbi:MAG: exodeoxyribonuclease I [Sphaerochaetaceae bacterium]|jgi:exodeoxyribonuclease-1
MNKETFFWYDLETFGLNPSYDRVAQFAGQRTDMDLNPIGDPVILYCRLSEDYLPDPLSCLVTGITPQQVNQKGLCEADFIKRILNELSVPGTCTAGFNSIRFDDEFIRNLCYRNFIDPYQREWKNGNSRWDIIDLVRACHDLRPMGIKWPEKNPETGNPVFKLTSLTEANDIDQTGAHDAMVDVNATIAIARLLKRTQPRLFDHFLRLRRKSEAKNYLDLPFKSMFIHTGALFTSPNGCTRPVTVLTVDTKSDTSFYCFDLTQDPQPLLSATDKCILRSPGLFKIASNKCPFLAPMNVLTGNTASRLGIDLDVCQSRYQLLQQNSYLISAIREAASKELYPTIEDPDFQLYSGSFFPDSDLEAFRTIQATPPAQLPNLRLQFSDYRCDPMLFRHIGRNYPQLLDQKGLEQWMSFCASRLLCPPGNIVNSLAFYERKVEEKLQSNDITPKEKVILEQLSQYGQALKEKVFGKQS